VTGKAMWAAATKEAAMKAGAAVRSEFAPND
jgi:hypothetical protein